MLSTELVLHLHGDFRRESVGVSVNVRLEGDAIFIDLGDDVPYFLQ